MGRDSLHTFIYGRTFLSTAALWVGVALVTAVAAEAGASQPGAVRPQVIRTISESGGDVINAVELIAFPTSYYRPATARRAQAMPNRSSACPASRRNGVSLVREGFVLEIIDLALEAGRELGVDSRAIVAQAALETGWGTRDIRRGDGTSSFNLFGIKASGWSGDIARTFTHEHVGGALRREMASFRAYRSNAESIADYVRMLKSSPRYQMALNSGGSVLQFAYALQQAGYATDPNYASKIYDIAYSDSVACAYKTYASTPRRGYDIAGIN